MGGSARPRARRVARLSRVPEGQPMRLQKFLSRAGVASRREGERLMEAGRVSVDGHVVTAMGTKVVPGRDVVRVDGERVEIQPERWVALYKPAGYLTTRNDEQGRRTVYSLVPAELHELFHVGRLDRESEGLLILTNAGNVAHRLLHPSFEIPRRYRVELASAVSPAAAERLEVGIELEDGLARAEDVRLEPSAGGEGARVTLTMREGRKREVRRMMAVLDLPVRRLVRLSFGPIELGGLNPGDWRDLDPAEIDALRRAVDMDRADGDT